MFPVMSMFTEIARHLLDGVSIHRECSNPVI